MDLINENTLTVNNFMETISHEQSQSPETRSMRYAAANYKFGFALQQLRTSPGYEILSCLSAISRVAGASVGLHLPITASVRGISTNDQSLIDILAPESPTRQCTYYNIYLSFCYWLEMWDISCFSINKLSYFVKNCTKLLIKIIKTNPTDFQESLNHLSALN